MDEIQTPEETSEINVEMNIEGTEPEGTEANEETPPAKEPEVDYKEKFTASAKEAQRLAQEQKDLQAKVEADRTRLERLEAEKADLENRFKEEKPEEYDVMQTKRELETIKRDLVVQKEETALNAFLAENSEAPKEQKEVLRKLGRANPNLSYGQIWSDIVKPIMEAGAAQYGSKQAEKKTTQPETGKGSTASPDEDLDLQALNKLPLSERKKRLEKILAKGDLIL